MSSSKHSAYTLCVALPRLHCDLGCGIREQPSPWDTLNISLERLNVVFVPPKWSQSQAHVAQQVQGRQAGVQLYVCPPPATQVRKCD